MSRHDVEDYKLRYARGESLSQISDATGIPISTVRHQLLLAGVQLRTAADGMRASISTGRRRSLAGVKRGEFSQQWKDRISAGRIAWAEKHATGVSLKPSGYIEHTRGPNKHRSQHVVIMEALIGRRLREDECVHHIDGDRTNNAAANLELMTRQEHSRHHALENVGRRLRNGKGQFS